jgi:riboflavin transporter FmnP
MLSSIAFVLMLLNFPFPGLPTYLKIDFSDIPALLATLLYGPVAGIVVEGIKNILHYIFQGSGVPIGQAANFIAGVMFILPVAFMYKKLKTTKGIFFSLTVGTLIMTIVLSILNYFLILPAYTWFFNFPVLSTEELKTAIVAGILPFNIIKGLLITIVFAVIFSNMKPWLMNQRKAYK